MVVPSCRLSLLPSKCIIRWNFNVCSHLWLLSEWFQAILGLNLTWMIFFLRAPDWNRLLFEYLFLRYSLFLLFNLGHVWLSVKSYWVLSHAFRFLSPIILEEFTAKLVLELLCICFIEPHRLMLLAVFVLRLRLLVVKSLFEKLYYFLLAWIIFIPKHIWVVSQ